MTPEQQIAALTARLDEFAARLDTLDTRTAGLGEQQDSQAEYFESVTSR